MNFIFVSPHFPKTYWNFCDRLHRNGVNVLGIGDAPFDEIPWELKQCLTEYYRVNDLGNYDEMLRAVAYFTFHYGKIDWIESNNEYWLEMDAQLRTERLDDRADEQRAEEALRHCAERIDAVALGRNFNVFAFAERFEFFHDILTA